MKISIRLTDVIEKTLARRPQTMKRAERLLPAIQVELNLARQIHRFAQLELSADERTSSQAKTMFGVVNPDELSSAPMSEENEVLMPPPEPPVDEALDVSRST